MTPVHFKGLKLYSTSEFIQLKQEFILQLVNVAINNALPLTGRRLCGYLFSILH